MKYWKIILAVSLMASLLLPAASLAKIHNATGTVSFSDSDAIKPRVDLEEEAESFSSNLSDKLTVSIQNIFEPGIDADDEEGGGQPELLEVGVYFAWLSSDDQSSFLPLGATGLDGSGGGSLTDISPTGQNLIDNYNGIWVTRTDVLSTQPYEERVVMSDVILPGSMAHIRHVMSAWSSAPDGKGLAMGSREQTDVALTHASLSVNSTSLANIQLHARHVINIVEGSSGANYDASFGDPGDGFGVLTYAADAAKHAGFAAAVEGASSGVMLHSVHVQDTSTNVVSWATVARDKALEALAAMD